ncbi:chaplin [Streptomyces sp. NPDC020983]|uniref:chaplin n=1 Tax=Streptomyces sp. NPDC020983 TaxID=3365106 RepID=UPI00379C11BE
MRRQILNRGLLTVAAASSILAVTGGYAHADSAAQGGQNAPRHSADDLSQQDEGATSPSSAAPSHTDAAAIAAAANEAATGGGATAQGDAEGSPGVLSGNSVSVPVDVPVNACGNSVDVVGLLNPSFGNSCANGTPAQQVVPPQRTQPPAVTPQAPAPEVHTQLAETGSSGGVTGAAAGAGAILLLGGTMVYRRSARAARIRRTYS